MGLTNKANVPKSREMASVFHSKFRRVLSAIALTALMFPFQNCSRPAAPANEESKASLAADGGGGVDGKPFQTYDYCGNQVGISQLIEVAADRKSAVITREDCQDLKTPKSVDMSNLVFSTADRGVLGLNGHAFDRQGAASADQQITVLFCQSSGVSPSVQALVWSKASDLSSFSGNVKLSSGASSGTLKAQQIDSKHYSAGSGANQFDLKLSSGTSGTLAYSVASTPGGSVPVNCSRQSPPLIVQQFSGGSTATSPTTYVFNVKATKAGNLLVVGVLYGPGQRQFTSSITDDAGNTYAVVPNSFSSNTNSGSTEIWYAVNSKPGATRVVVTEGGSWRPQVFFTEVSGINMNDPINGAPALNDVRVASTVANAPAISASANDFIFSILSTQNSVLGMNNASIFTAFPIYDGDGAAYYVPAAAGTYGAIWNQQNGTYCGSTVAFRAAW